MGISFWQILIIMLVVVLLFGAGKIPRLAGDVAKGIKIFRKNMTDDPEKASDTPKQIDVTPTAEAAPANTDATDAAKRG